MIEHPERLPHAAKKIEVKAESSGYVAAIEAESIGIAAMLLGAGRETKESQIDLAVGIDLRKKVADPVQAGDVLAILHVNDESRASEASARIVKAYQLSSSAVEQKPLVYAIVSKDGVQRFV